MVALLFAAMLFLQEGSWFSIPQMPEGRQEVGVVATEGRVYVIGGLTIAGTASNRVDVFDTHSGSWLPAPSLPIATHHPMVAALGHKIYLAGGYTDPGFFAHRQVYELDPDLSAWTRRADMPTPRGAGAASSYGGKIYVFGGERDGLTVNEVASYDPITNAWSTLPPMPTPRNHHGASLVGGRIYVIGGRPGNQSTNEEFDVTTQMWRVRAPLPTGRSGIAVATIGQNVFVFGGEGNASSPAGTFNQNESYDTDADAWTTLQPMPMPRHGIGAGVVGNRIYIPAGGPIAGFGVTPQSDFFEVAEDILLPQFVVGGGYRSEVVVSNPASRPVEVVLSVLDISGAPLVTQIDGASRSSLSFTVPPLASRTISAPETSGTLRAGTVRIHANARINTFAIIRISGGSAATVYPVTPTRNSVFHVRVNRSDQTNTGVAVANTAAQSQAVTLALFNETGAEIARLERMLAPGAQLAGFINELFPAVQQSDFSGSMTVRAVQAVSVVSIAFSRDGVVTIPVSPIE